MSRFSTSLLISFLMFTSLVRAQEVESDLIVTIDALSSPEMHGRGYVKDGRELAAKYLIKKYKKFGLVPVTKDSTYIQAFDFPVNTFPGKMELHIDDENLKAGRDFLIDAASTSFSRENLKVKTISLKKVHDTTAWREVIAGLDTGYAYHFTHVDDFCEETGMRKNQMVKQLPAGLYIIPEEKKLIWTVSRDTTAATVFYVRESALPKKMKRMGAQVNSLFIPEARSENIIGCVPGEVKDSFIAFTAHYDHLGMMGSLNLFPGASDNASGTAMMLSLASYFSQHPQHYSILFIAFAGEEAGLMGSEFYTWQPTVPLSKIKFLTNIDIMGDATDGITVVNGTKFPDQFNTLKQINEKQKYIDFILARGEAANSDHYYFSEAGVPCFFVYSNGGKGYYHDVFDATKEVTLTNIAAVRKLLIDFTAEIH